MRNSEVVLDRLRSCAISVLKETLLGKLDRVFTGIIWLAHLA
jgi:hypothetical protein